MRSAIAPTFRPTPLACRAPRPAALKWAPRRTMGEVLERGARSCHLSSWGVIREGGAGCRWLTQTLCRDQSSLPFSRFSGATGGAVSHAVACETSVLPDPFVVPSSGVTWPGCMRVSRVRDPARSAPTASIKRRRDWNFVVLPLVRGPRPAHRQCHPPASPLRHFMARRRCGRAVRPIDSQVHPTAATVDASHSSVVPRYFLCRGKALALGTAVAVPCAGSF